MDDETKATVDAFNKKAKEATTSQDALNFAQAAATVASSQLVLAQIASLSK